MKKEIKNFFLTFIKLNKEGLILALLFFLVFGLIFPPQKTWAQIEGFSLNCGWADLFCAALEAFLSGILKIVILIFFGIPLLLSALFVGIMSLILGWIISPAFISLKFTQNPFVNIGLSITKNFANMGFIIFLVAIGLATALRIEEYKAKKTLITLILIALLVNFSPVLCGFIIDASNIVMNFFLNHVTGLLGFYNFVMEAAKALQNLLVTSGFNLWANISAAMQIIIMIVFNFFAGYIFILFSALFIMRYIMLWILVILSPIAFVSYILPITRRGGSLLSWRTWWEQLVAWAIIGIIAAFFLYLGFTMIAMINANPREFVCLPGDKDCGSGGLGLMNNILPYLIPLILLLIAQRETKRTSAMFAKEAIEMTEKVGKAAGQVAVIALTAGAAAGAAAGALGKAATGAQKLETTLGKVPIVGKPLKYGVGKPISWAFRGAEKLYAPPLLEYAAKTRRVKIPEEFEKMSAVEQERLTKLKLTPEERIQFASKMIDLGTFDKTSEEFRKKIIEDAEKKAEGPYYKKEVDKIRKALPDLVTAKLMVNFEIDPKAKQEMEKKIKDMATTLNVSEDSAAKIILTSKIKGEDVPKIATKEFWKDKDIMYGMQMYWGGSQYRKAAEKFEREFVDAFMEPLETKLKQIKSLPDAQAEKEYKELIYQNTARARYLETTAAQEFGFGSLYVLAPDVIKHNPKYKNIRDIIAEKP